MELGNLFLLSISLLLSAFFSGMEIAFITADRFRIELSNKQGSLTARILSGFFKNQSHFIGTTLVGNNISLVIYGIIMAGLLEPLIVRVLPEQFISEILLITSKTIIATSAVILVGEFLPKVLFRIQPNFFLKVFAFPMLGFYYLLYPFVFFIVFLSKYILLKIFRVHYVENKSIIGRGEIISYLNDNALRKGENKEVDPEILIFKNALDFSKVKARECMVPRTEIASVELSDSPEYILNKFTDTRYSKILIYEKAVDNIIGYVHMFDMFNKPEKISDVLLPINIVPESMSGSELLAFFTQKRKSVALVVDEFGTSSGLVTLEDVMEEIVGEIADEHDADVLVEKQISEDEFIFSARLEIDYLNQKYNLGIPDVEFETLGGYILAKHENIPQKMDKLIIDNFLITILEVSNTRIEKVQLQIIENIEFED